ncbi:MAG TPA: LacI family DNA-binding transcriptional regulator [Alphaproteobacteria bacterium]|nr:LacI family DNA-binding transcriptional regulator [Alphaproteobacteria bacterium]
MKVAERAGVSPTTVSHVLNHADRVSDHLRARVLQAIEELGYIPNSNAKSLRTGRSNIVALLIPDIQNSFYTELVRAAQTELRKTGRDVMVFNADVPGGNPKAHSRQYLEEVRSKGIDGLIVGDFALHGMYDAIERVTIPSVFVGFLPNGGVDNVRAADYDGCHMIARHLVGKGHSRIAHVTGPADFPAAMMRRDGFRDGCLSAGLDPDALIVRTGTYLSPSGEAAIHKMFGPAAPDERPTAVFFSNLLMCRGGLAAIGDLGLSIPDDVAVAVFGNMDSMEYIRPRLTRVGVDPRNLAVRAVQMLVDRMDGTAPGNDLRSEMMECSLVLGDSA